MFLAQRLHQRGYLVKVVPWHSGKQAERQGRWGTMFTIIHSCLLSSVLNKIIYNQKLFRSSFLESGTEHREVGGLTSLLVFNLEVEMPTPPVSKEGLVDITGGFQLWRHPVLGLVVVYSHRQMTHLRGPHEPVALQEPGQYHRNRGSHPQYWEHSKWKP